MEEKKRFVLNVLFFGLIALIAYLFYEYIFSVTLPFIFGFFLAYFAIKLCNKLFINDDKWHRAACLISIYLIIVVITTLLIVSGVNKSIDFFSSVPKLYVKYVEPAFLSLEKTLNEFNAKLPTGIQEIMSGSISDVIDSLKSLVINVSSTLVSGLTNVIVNVPDALISVTVVILSSFYICFDYEKISSYFKKILPEKVSSFVIEVKTFCENNLFKIIRTYLVLMFITFVELFIAFLIFRIPSSGIVALIVSLVDILPILGVGTVLIPWSLIGFLTGNVKIGVEMLCLYLVITFIRNSLESKMVGGDLGLHPLATLVAMIVGLRLFGILGMLILPLTLSFIVKNRLNVES